MGPEEEEVFMKRWEGGAALRPYLVPRRFELNAKSARLHTHKDCANGSRLAGLQLLDPPSSQA